MTRPIVAILETGVQTQQVLGDPELRSRVDIWLAVGPEAAWHLQMSGIEYAKLEDFYEESSLGDRAEDVFMHQVAWADWVDGWLQAEVPQFKQYNIQLARAHFPFLKRFFDQLEITTYQLQAFLKGLQPGGAVYCEPPLDNPSPQVRFTSSVVGRILPILARVNNTKLTAVPLISQSPVDPPWRRPIVDRLPSNLRTELSLVQKLGFLECLRLIWHRLTDGNKILVIKEGYDVAPVLTQLAQCNFRPHVHRRSRSGRDALIRRTLTEQWDRIEKYDEFWAPVAVSNEGMSNLAKPRLSYWWHHVIPETWEIFIAERAKLERKQIPALVTTSIGGISRHRDIAIILAARSVGIPVIMYQHGGFVGACENLIWDMTDLWQADYELCYGEGVRTYFDKRSEYHATPMATPVPVGSARLDHVRRRSQRSKQIRASLIRDDPRPLVLYVPTAFCGPYRNLCCDSYPDVSYFELQQRVIDVFRRNSGVRLAYKVFSQTYRANLVPQIIRRKLPDAVVVDEFPLTDLMWAVDSVIVDFPSTGLLEVLMTRKPVLVYADKYSLRMLDEAKTLLRRRATLAETAEEFLNEVESVVRNGNFAELPAPDDSFLQAYGTHVGDGLSAIRAAEAIRVLARDHSRSNVPVGTAEAPEHIAVEGSR